MKRLTERKRNVDGTGVAFSCRNPKPYKYDEMVYGNNYCAKWKNSQLDWGDD